MKPSPPCRLVTVVLAIASVCAATVPVRAQANRPAEVTPAPEAPPSARNVLSALPAQVSAVIAVRDLSDLDAKLRRLTNRLGFPFSPYTLAKGWLEIVDGLDEHGPAAVALLPEKTPGEKNGSLVLVLPSTDRARLLSFLNPRPRDDGFVQVTLRGRDSYVDTRGGFAVFAPSPHVLEMLLGARERLSQRLSDYQRQRFNANDLSLWLEPESVKRYLASGGTGGKLSKVLADLSRWLGRIESLQLSARVEEGGLAFELLAEPAAEARSNETAETTDSLLEGIPDEPFALAMGMTAGQSGERARTLGTLLVSGAAAAGALDEARSADLMQTLDLVMRNVETVALAVSRLPPGPNGRLGVAKVVRTSSSGQMLLVEIEAVVRALKSGLFTDPVINRAMGELQYRRNVENVAGVAIDHLELDLSAFQAIDQKQLREVLGREGLLVRIGAVDNRRVVISFGGGVERFGEIVATVRAGRAPLAADTGMMMSALGVARKRSLEAYLSVDRTMNLLNTLSRVSRGGEPPFPEMPETNAPVAVAWRSVGDSGAQLDMFIPVELLTALRDVLMREAAAEVRLDR